MGVLRDSCDELEYVIRAQLEAHRKQAGGAVAAAEVAHVDNGNGDGKPALMGAAAAALASVGNAGKERPLAAARLALGALQTENEDLVMQLMDSKLQELSGQGSKLASTTLWMAASGGEREITMHLQSIARFFTETMAAMDGVPHPGNTHAP